MGVVEPLWDTINQDMLYHLKRDVWEDNSLYIMKTAGDYQVYLAFILVFHTGDYFEFIQIFG